MHADLLATGHGSDSVPAGAGTHSTKAPVNRSAIGPERSRQKDVSLILDVPFTDIRELSMDILRQGRHVVVLEPKELRDEVVSEMQSALNTYRQ